MPTTPEGIVKADIKELLDSYGDELYYFMPVQQGFGVRTVDFLLCYRGQFIAVEAKRITGRAKKFQAKLLDKVRDAGGHAMCIDSLAELKDLLDYLTSCRIRLVGDENVARPGTQPPDLRTP